MASERCLANRLLFAVLVGSQAPPSLGIEPCSKGEFASGLMRLTHAVSEQTAGGDGGEGVGARVTGRCLHRRWYGKDSSTCIICCAARIPKAC